jgi:hypothetical protein
MNKTRFNKVFGVFGDRGTGKTKYALGDKSLGLPGLVNVYLKRNMKVIAIDTIDHPAWRHVPILNPSNFSKFKKGIGRIITPAKDMDKTISFLNSHPNTWNSLLLFEDARKHTFLKVDDALIELIGDSKQKNIDIGFMYHCFAHCPMDLYRYFDYIQLFKTKDSPVVRKLGLSGCFEQAMEIYKKVQAHPSRFYNQLIDTGTD